MKGKELNMMEMGNSTRTIQITRSELTEQRMVAATSVPSINRTNS